jgi:hypothetical protein
MGLFSWVYAVRHAYLIACQVMNAPNFVAVMLAVLSREQRYPRGMA